LKGEDGRKFKTRSGDTVRLIDVLEEAREKARAILLERRTTANSTSLLTTDAEIEHAAAVLGYGGVKYFDLRQVRLWVVTTKSTSSLHCSTPCPSILSHCLIQHRLNDYEFSYERMLASDGDTAVYLEYALARVSSILRKARDAGVDVDALLRDGGAAVEFSHGSEVLLAWELSRFGEVIVEFTAGLAPHKFAEFLFALSTRMTAFHRDCNVLGADTPIAVRNTRLLLCAATCTVMRQAMLLLGLEPLERL
jgi:arginyl-tRNA synthetase